MVFAKIDLFPLVASLKRTLTKCKVLGWMEQITGHGFSGTYQLSFPYYPRYFNDKLPSFTQHKDDKSQSPS